jgi:histone H3/H4
MSKLAFATFEKILKESDKNIRVSDGATDAFIEAVAEISRQMAKDSAELARHAGRKTILETDVKLANKRRSY